MIVKRLLLLANSRKFRDRCIAGKEVVRNAVGAWMRPVTSGEHGTVDRYTRQYGPGIEPEVLDFAEIGVSSRMPHDLQPENWLLDRQHLWRRVGQAGWDDLKRFVDPVEPLWTNGHNTGHGRNDRIPVADVGKLLSSLRLIHVDSLSLFMSTVNGCAHIDGAFAFNGDEYRLRVTDPVYEQAYRGDGRARVDLGESYLTISIGEPFDGYCYKLIAAIIERARVSP